MPEDIYFLSREDIEFLHRESLDRHGGAEGVIDESVVLSALGAPQATMFGQFLNEDISAMAAAYLYSFAMSQGFRDGNKRTAVSAAFSFLSMNGYTLECEDLELYQLTMLVSNGLMDKDGVADWILERIVAVPDEP